MKPSPAKTLILALSALLGAGASPLYAQGTCLAATDLTAQEIPFGVIVDNSATGNGASVSCVAGPSGNDVWILLPALTPGAQYEVATGEVGGSPVSDTRLEIFHGACAGLVSIACADNASDTQLATATFIADDAGPYRVLLETLDSTQSGEFLVTLTQTSDLQPYGSCDFALDMSNAALPMSVTLDTTDGSDVTGITCGDGTGGPERWVKLPALQGGQFYNVYTSSEPGAPAEVDTRLEVFVGSDCATLNRVGCNDDISSLSKFSSVGFIGISGSSYWAFVESTGTDTDGPFKLNVDAGIVISSGAACTNAVNVSGTPPILLTAELAGETSLTDNACGPQDGAPERWFQLPPLPANKIYSIDTLAATGSPPDTRLALFTGTCGNLVPVACNDDDNFPTDKFSRITYQGDPSKTFFLMVESAPANDANNIFFISINEASTITSPTNETCATALQVGTALLPDTTTIDVRVAVDDGDLIPLSAADEEGVDVFFRFTPSATGRYTFSASFTGQGNELCMSLLSDNTCAILGPACGTPVTAAAPVLTAALQASTAYIIVLDDPDSSTKPDSYTLTIDGPDTSAPAANPTCVTAANIGGFPFASSQNSTGGTSSLELAKQLGGDSCLGELYYKITPATDISVFVKAFTTGVENPAVLGAFTGACGALVPDGPAVLGEGRYILQGGVPVVFAIEPFQYGDQGFLTFFINEVPIPDGDYCPEALEITSVPYTMNVDLEGAGDEGLDAPCVFADSTGNKRDMFWTFTPTATANYRIDAGVPGERGSAADTGIAVYTGDCGSLTNIACRNATDAGEFLTVELQSGVAYTIQIEGAGVLSTDEINTFDLNVTQVPDATGGNDCNGALNLTQDDLPFAQTIDTSGNNGFSPHRLPGPTHTYRLTSNVRALVTVTATPQSSGLDPAIAAFSDTCDARFKNWYSGDEASAAINAHGVGAAEELIFEVRRDDPVTIYIESADTVGGNIHVTMTFKEIPEGSGWLAR